MGKYMLDQYSFLHYSVGATSYFWNISFIVWNIIHIIFEIIENSSFGINFINKYLTIWPGGKPEPDTIYNSMGDIICGALGWSSSYLLDLLGKKYKWYNPHFNL